MSHFRCAASQVPAALLCLILVGWVGTSCTSITPTTVDVEAALEIAEIDTFNNALSDASTDLPPRVNLAMAKSAALQRNPDLEVTRSRIRTAMARARQAAAAFYPTVRADFAISHVQDVAGNEFPVPERIEFYNPKLSFEWLAYDGYRRQLDEVAAKYSVETATAAHEDAQRILLGAVARAFYTAALARDRMRVATADREFNTRLLDETEKEHKASIASRTDVNNFRLRLNNANVVLINATRDHDVALAVLAELLGAPSADLAKRIDLDVAFESVLARPVPEFGSELATARERRADLRELAARMAELKARHDAAVQAQLPTVRIAGDVGVSSQDNLKFRQEEQSSSVAVIASWDLFTGGAKTAAIDITATEYDTAIKQLRDRYEAIVAEVRQRQPVITSARATYETQRDSVRLAREIREDVEKEYRAGIARLTRLNEAQRDLNIAELNLALSQTVLLQAYSDLDTATGRVLD
jgi:outer membrane protein